MNDSDIKDVQRDEHSFGGYDILSKFMIISFHMRKSFVVTAKKLAFKPFWL